MLPQLGLSSKDVHEVPSNIDVQYVSLKGCVARFPVGLQLF